METISWTIYFITVALGLFTMWYGYFKVIKWLNKDGK